MNCGQHLQQVPQLDLRDSSRLLETQRRINRVLETGQDETSGLPALDFFHTLRSLCTLMLYVAQPQDLGALPAVVEHTFRKHAQERDHLREQGRRQRAREGSRGVPIIHVYGPAPTQVALMAALLPKATETLRSSTPGKLVMAELSAQLQPFVQRLRDRNQGHLRNVARDCNFQGPLLQAWNEGLSNRAGFDHRLGLLSTYARADRPYTFDPQHVPQLLWENEYKRHFRRFFSESSVQDYTNRQLCSAALVKLVRETTWAGAFRMLDLPDMRGRASKAMALLNAPQNSHAFALALHDLAARLEALPVRANYQVRRLALDGLTEIPADEWQVFTEQYSFLQGWRQQRRRRHIAVWLWAQVTGGDWRLAPALRGMNVSQARTNYKRSVWQDLPKLHLLLSARAAQMAAEIDVACPELRLEFPQDD